MREIFFTVVTVNLYKFNERLQIDSINNSICYIKKNGCTNCGLSVLIGNEEIEKCL